MSRRQNTRKINFQKHKLDNEYYGIIEYVQEKFAYLYLEEDLLHHEIRRER